MAAGKVRVAVVGTGRWAQVAHIPGWLRDPRAEVVALADVSEPRCARRPTSASPAPSPTTANCSATRTSMSWTS